MAKSNRERVGELLDILRDGLGPYVLREYKMVFKKEAVREIATVLTTQAFELSRAALTDDAALLSHLDIHSLLNLMWRRWNDVFQDKLGHSGRNYVSELMTVRNDWAHQKPFANDDADRAADTSNRLLKAIGDPTNAEKAYEIKREIVRLRFESEEKRSRTVTTRIEEQPVTTLQGLKPWRMVVQPHPDVANGRYLQAEFAADLAQVVAGKAAAEYGDPKEFFRRTYLTEGLSSLLVTGIKRLTGNGGDPVVQLQTPFGGGKTHSMLALYHLMGGKIGISEIPNGDALLQRIGKIDDVIHANRAVVVGTDFSATEPRAYKDATVHTLWGEIAYQLGGLPGYRLVEDADVSGVSPGAATLVTLLEQHGPALIILDELVAYARNLYNVAARVTGGSFESVMTFIQALTEAVKRSSDSMLLVSIPQSVKLELGTQGGKEAAKVIRESRFSDAEIGGKQGEETLSALENTIGRVDAIWKPISALEGFEIVRRRLFSSDLDYGARDAVISAFRELYATHKSEFPTGSSEGDYLQRLRAAYPIHPELFDRLYEDWSTLEKFQRTRGVLRLMAEVIHELWLAQDNGLLIMPGSIPLHQKEVQGEFSKYLPENWSAIIDADIDGRDSRPAKLDERVPTLARHAATRRVARAVFMGSAPSATGQTSRGVEESRIRLGVAQPGEPLAVFGDALRRMSNELTYLYSDGTRYWYDTRPTVNRLAQERAQNVPADTVYEEVVKRLKAIKYNRQQFNAAHVAPEALTNAEDEDRFRVVVYSPDYPHKRNDPKSKAIVAATETLNQKPTGPRLYRNMLAFIAPDEGEVDALNTALREHLAWRSIQAEQDQLELGKQQQKQVTDNCKRTDETVEARLRGAYSWLLVPVQHDPQKAEILIESYRITGDDNFYERAHRQLTRSEQLIHRWSPDNLRDELDRFLWRGQSHVSLKQLWEDLSRYCYLPRLFDKEVLLDTIQSGIGRLDAPFGYATGVAADGRYKGLLFREAGGIYFDSDSIVVRHDVADAQKFADSTPAPSLGTEGGGQNGGTDWKTEPDKGKGVSSPQKRRKSRYFGAARLNPERVNKEIATIVEEVIERLSSVAGSTVELTLEIRARHPNGFDDNVVLAVTENSKTLKFTSAEFEE